jgi:DNA-binding transcriptional LysR family regulator
MQWNDRIGRRVRLRDLHVLLAVIHSGSMAKAAQTLSVSHPVISKTIGDLERTLGVRLLDRSPHGIEPTLYGREVITWGVTVFDELRQGVKRLEFLKDPTQGELRIGSTDALMAGFVPSVIDHMTRKAPGVAIHTIDGPPDELRRAIRERRIDLFVARSPQRAVGEDLAEERLFDESLLIVAGTQNPLVRRRKLTLADLIDEPWIMLPVGNPAGLLFAEACGNLGLPLPRGMVFSESGPLRNSLLATGRFLTVAAGSALHFTAKRLGLKILPVRLPIEPRPVSVTTLQKRTISPVAQLFLVEAREVATAMGKAPSGKPR